MIFFITVIIGLVLGFFIIIIGPIAILSAWFGSVVNFFSNFFSPNEEGQKVKTENNERKKLGFDKFF